MKPQNLLASLAVITPSAAWYLQVHNQLGYVADQMLNRNTQYMVRQILEPEYQGSVGRAAAWADTVSKGTAPYSYGWHWISARDEPPDDCSLFYHRDCQKGGCVVQQIYNQTEILKPCVARLSNGQYYPDVDCQQALKWIIHFVMDVSEPMHTSLKAYGGNTFKVVFNGIETNMHQTWDRWILYSQTDHPNGFRDDAIDPYFQSIYQKIQEEIKGGYARFREQEKHWDQGCPPRSLWRGTICPELWAKDSNRVVCDYAYGRWVNGSDLYKDGYAKGAFHIVELQLAKAAWRTAYWLNTIADAYLGSNSFGGNDAMNPMNAESQGFGGFVEPFVEINPVFDGVVKQDL